MADAPVEIPGLMETPWGTFVEEQGQKGRYFKPGQGGGSAYRPPSLSAQLAEYIEKRASERARAAQPPQVGGWNFETRPSLREQADTRSQDQYWAAIARQLKASEKDQAGFLEGRPTMARPSSAYGPGWPGLQFANI